MRKKICVRLFVFLLIFSVFSELNTAQVKASPASADLEVKREFQEKSNWCWAAAAQMVGQYLGNTKKQSDICKKVKGNATINETATLNETVKAIKYAAGTKHNCYYLGVMTYGDLQTYLGDLKIPQAIRMQWDEGGGHMIVLEGYTEKRKLRVVDPGNGCGKKEYYYSALVNGTSIKSGTGHYSHTFVVE